MRRCSGVSTKKQPAERPERLPAEVGRRLLLHDHDALPGVGELGGGGEAGEPGPYDDGVGVGHGEAGSGKEEELMIEDAERLLRGRG